MLDKKDKEIILALDYKARTSLSAIARDMRLSKDSVIARIRKLEESGIISRYYSVINYFRIGYKTFKLYVKLNRFDEELEKELIIYLRPHKFVRFVSFVTDDYDIIITFNVKEENSFYDFYKNLSIDFSEFILEKHFALINSQYHFLHPMLEGKRNQSFISRTEENSIGLSEFEKELISILSLNAKISFTELSQRLGKNANTILYALRSLEKKEIVIGHRPRIDYSKLGMTHYMVNLNFAKIDKKTYSDLLKAISMLQGIIYISEGVAHFDMEFELVCMDNVELMNRLKEIKNRFGTSLVKINTRTVVMTQALNYSPF